MCGLALVKSEDIACSKSLEKTSADMHNELSPNNNLPTDWTGTREYNTTGLRSPAGQRGGWQPNLATKNT